MDDDDEDRSLRVEERAEAPSAEAVDEDEFDDDDAVDAAPEEGGRLEAADPVADPKTVCRFEI